MADLSQFSDDDLMAIAGQAKQPESRLPEAIGGFESGGNYRAVGPIVSKGAYAGDRAYGKYQVMGKNIPEWSQEVLGRRVTPMEFLANDQLQDTIAKAKLGQLEAKHGPGGAARAWFAGEGGMNDPNRKDQLGTTVAGYERNVMALRGPDAPPQAAPQAAPLAAPATKALSDYSDEELLAIANPTFKERFGGFDIPKDAKTMEPALRSAADEMLMKQMEAKFGSRPSPSTVANNEFINTAALNAPRNLKAYLRSQKEDIPFATAYEQLKSEEEAAARQSPKASLAGTGAGIGAGVVTLPSLVKSGAGLTARALGAGATAGTYAGIAEAFDSKDPLQVSIAAGLGAGLGAVAAPVAEKIVGLASGMVRKGFDMAKMLKADGSLTDEAANAARAAGVEPEDMRRVFAQTLTDRLGVQKRGQTVAAVAPQEAGETVAAGVRGKAAQSQADYRGKYDEMRGLPGQFDDITFTGVGGRIQKNLASRAEPVIVDEVTTPVANRMLVDVEKTLGRTTAEGAPDAADLSLKGIDQARKRLVELSRGVDPRNLSDRRAARAVINSLDDEIEQSMLTGLFKGDERAYGALKEARDAYVKYRETFKTKNPKDDAGRAVEKIIREDSTGQEVANLIYGGAKIGEQGSSVRLAQKLKGILGEGSEEWAAVRQGLWQKLTAKPEGVDGFGPKALSDRIMTFVNGPGSRMAQEVFSPAERTEMLRLAQVVKSAPTPKKALDIVTESGIAGSIFGGAHFGLGMDPTTAGALSSARIGYKLLKAGRQLGQARTIRNQLEGRIPQGAGPTGTAVGLGLDYGQ